MVAGIAGIRANTILASEVITILHNGLLLEAREIRTVILPVV